MSSTPENQHTKQPLNQNYQSTYQSFTDIGDPVHNPHLFIHVASANKVSRRWQAYISDLDDFFEKIYNYYQRSGFVCIVVSNILELVEIIAVILLTFFFLHCVDYDILFKNKTPPNHPKDVPLKITIVDCLIPISEVTISSFEVILLVFALSFWFIKLGTAIYSIISNYAIRSFFIEALQIHDVSLYSWQEVQTRLVRAQSHCLIREGHLDELAIHNRLLRRANYMIALVNKGILPIYYRLPIVGEIIFLTSGLEFNFNLLLFRGVFSLFEKNWKLRDEVKSPAERIECSRRFANRCLVLGIINLFLLPFILVWQSLYAFYTYVEAIKRDPTIASSRTWSRYGRWFCRHFNELEHELDQRLNRAHRSATRYMDSFRAPLLEIIARFFTFVAGTLLSVLIVLTVYDEDVITVEHLLTLATALGAIIAISRAMLPDSEPNRWTLSELDAAVLQHIHYRPHSYPAHTIQARNAMTNIFVYKSTTILEELVSSLVTPYILIRHLRPRAIEIIDFFRVYTIELADIGDVCTFSQFNFHQNGHRIFNDPTCLKKFNSSGISSTSVTNKRMEVLADERHTTRNGKLELSLINFKLMNPSWQPQSSSQIQFIDRFTRQSKDEVVLPKISNMVIGGDINLANIESRSTIDFYSPSTSKVVDPIQRSFSITTTEADVIQKSQSNLSHDQTSQSLYRRSFSEQMTDSELQSRYDFGFGQKRRRLLQKRYASIFSEQEEREADMSLSSLYFHQIVSNLDDTSRSMNMSMAEPSTSRRDITGRSTSNLRTTNESIPLLKSSHDPNAD